MNDELRSKTYQDGLNDGARVCEDVASELKEKGHEILHDLFMRTAECIRLYEPGSLPQAVPDTEQWRMLNLFRRKRR